MIRIIKVGKKRKKGFVLSLDALLAVFILVIGLTFTLSYFYQTKQNLNNLYMSKQPRDAMVVLDYRGTLDNASEDDILEEIQAQLQDTYGAKFNITIVDRELGLETTKIFSTPGSSIEDATFVTAGKRFFARRISAEPEQKNFTLVGYGVINYWTWKK